MTHFLKFTGLLFLMSLAAVYVPFGNIFGAALVFYGLWKITE